MHNKRTIIVATIFLASLFLGFLGGAFAIQSRQTPRNSPTPITIVTQTASAIATHAVPVKASNVQQNHLLIIIDNRSTKPPQVEGIWLVIGLPNNSHLTFLPIYPSNASGGALSSRLIAKHFSVDTDGAPSVDFLKSIDSLGLFWDNYFVLDRKEMAALIDQLKMAGLTDDSLEPSAFPTYNGNPQANLRSQAVLLENICRGMSRISTPDQASQIINHLSQHLLSNLPPERVVSGLQSLLSLNGSPFCEFPILPQPKASQN